MKYKEVVEGFEVSPSGEEKGVKQFLKKNKYVVAGLTVAIIVGVVYYYQSKKKQ
jgi:preprotein translocase subunit SecG